MSGLLIKLFIPQNATEGERHARCGILSGVVGIILNILLVAGKLTLGIVTGSVAMIADAVNNLSDAASSAVTLAGFKLASQKPDKEHPFGHGRIEYVTGLIVSVLIIFMAFELGYSSVEKIISPEKTQFSYVALGILIAAILIKLWLFYFNRRLAKIINSSSLKATATDSLYDVFATSVVLASLVAGQYTDIPIDGVAGLIVALFILKAGIDAVKSTQAPLLGRPMNRELAKQVDYLALEHENILGVHDLVYHDYGPGRAIVSFHIEVPSDMTLVDAHSLADHIEREIKEKFNIDAVIHADPVIKDEMTEKMKNLAEKAAKSLDPRVEIHDLQYTEDDGLKIIYFDMILPFDLKLSADVAKSKVIEFIRREDDTVIAQINVDYPFIES
ncbi:MAG: cation diffusion facilitator family transporter [Clostridia bacterium]|nr:cation diffusion facilitator family transporter [Clostridia bacterium]